MGFQTSHYSCNIRIPDRESNKRSGINCLVVVSNMVAAKFVVEFKITSQKREYNLKILKNIGYVSLLDLANCCDFDAVEELKSKDVAELFGAFQLDPNYANVDPLYYLFDGGDRSNPMRSTFVHPDIALYFVYKCRPVLALWIAKQIREALLYQALEKFDQIKVG